MPYYPIFLDIAGRACAVVGGGAVAERKVMGLLMAGGIVTVISPKLVKTLKRLVDEKKIEYKKSVFKKGMLNGFFIVISASNSASVNAQVKKQANKVGALVNVVDAPPLCDFLVPSTVRRADLTIAVSTSGKSPALAKKIRRDIETLYGVEYEIFVALLGSVRNKLLKDKRKYGIGDKLYRELVDSEVPRWIKLGRLEEVDTFLRSLFDESFSLKSLGLYTGTLEVDS